MKFLLNFFAGEKLFEFTGTLGFFIGKEMKNNSWFFTVYYRLQNPESVQDSKEAKLKPQSFLITLQQFLVD